MTAPRLAHEFTLTPSPRRRGHARMTGLLVAAGIGLIFAGIIGWFVIRAPQTGIEESSGPRPAELPESAEQPGGKERSQLDAMGQNSGPFMQFADRRDPTRIAGEISAERAEPLEGRRYRLDAPRAWSFLRDGRTLYIEAKTARASFAEAGAKGRPEEATLEGDVRIRLFAPRADKSRPDPAKDTPLFTAGMDELRYDGTLGRLLIPANVSIIGERVKFEGSDITLLFNESAEKIDSLKIARTKALQFMLQGGDRTKEESVASIANSTPTTNVANAANREHDSNQGDVVEYTFTASGEISIVNGTRRITGDVLTGWFRTIDNQLPSGFVRTQPESSSIRSRSLVVPGIAMLQVGDGNSSTTPNSTAPVIVSFSGPFEMTPLSSTPPELNGEDIYARISAPLGEYVVATDEQSRAIAKGVAFEYGTVRQRIAIRGDESRELTINVPGQGVLHAQDVRVDLSTGDARISGGGRLERLPVEGGSSGAQLAWTEDAIFAFTPGRLDSDSKIKRAEFIGNVSATDTGGSFTANRVIAEFDDAAERGTIRRAELIGAAKAGKSDGSSLAADRIDVTFSAGSTANDIIPRRVDARDSVVGVRKTENFRAGSLAADFVRDEDGKLLISHAEADSGVEYANSDGMRAIAPRMDADPIAGFVELSGEGTRVAKDETEIKGSKIRLFADERRLEVPVAGEFTHAEPAKEGSPRSVAKISWKDSMNFSDGMGRAECNGDARAELITGEIERSTLDARRVTVLIEPATDSASTTRGAINRSSRKVTRVEAEGGETPVKAESRRYEPGKPETLAQLLYLESAKVVALGVEGVIHVPQEGKLLAVDRRPSSSTDSKSLQNSGRGDALFRWKNALTLDRAKGELKMEGEVQLDHRTLDDGSRVRLECDSLTALTDSIPEGADDNGVGQLRKAIATGKVWVRGMGRELTAAEVAYDAKSSLVTASGGKSSKVNVVDTKTGSPFAARWLNWNLLTGRVEALSADPMIVPR